MTHYNSPALNELQDELDRTGVISDKFRGYLMSYALECHSQGWRRGEWDAAKRAHERAAKAESLTAFLAEQAQEVVRTRKQVQEP